MAEHTEELIELMRKTIEQKDAQIQELCKTVGELRATVMNLNKTLEEFRRKFFGTSSERSCNRETDEKARQEPE